MQYQITFGPHTEIDMRTTTTDVLVNGTKVALQKHYNGRDRDTLSIKWDQDGLKKFGLIQDFVDDYCESGTRKSDWWDPISLFLVARLKAMGTVEVKYQ